MRQLILVLGSVALLCSQAFAQTQSEQLTISPCTLTMAQSPAIRDVRLGMSARELFALFPGSAEKDEIKAALKSG